MSTLSPSRVPEPESSVERGQRSRLRGHRRILSVVGMLLALVGGVAVDSGTAFAQPPSGSCTHTCNNPPAGVSRADWNAANQAADFWANHTIDFHAVNYSGGRSYYHLDQWAGRGWPGQATGGQWFGYWEPSLHRTQFVYYGGRFNDNGGNLANHEQNFLHVSASRAFSTGNGRTAPYVEYDLDYHNVVDNRARGQRRIVRNPNTGNTYVTYDHYQSFYYLGRW
ncbi:ribonuclease domain-containing protein [Streptomyces sp. NBC_01235]|uniref:ribonuclease domain-containing protein n=1 Tax=Streptomyces sp. NBC_01235 TaxID=2903788 RepID=UPI002E0EDB86|nr:hypothetical protein OG289_09070 [Streptomyces sp. NBC_01235]